MGISAHSVAFSSISDSRNWRSKRIEEVSQMEHPLLFEAYPGYDHRFGQLIGNANTDECLCVRIVSDFDDF